MINITHSDKSNFRLMDEYEVGLYVKYAQAYAFRQIGELAWEVDYFRRKDMRKPKSPKYTHPNF